MFGSPEIFSHSCCGVFFFNCIPFKARCALSIFPMLKQCAGRGKQVWGSVLTKGKGLVKREEPLAFVNPGSYTGLNRQKLPLHRKFRMGTHDGRRRMQLKKYGTASNSPSEIPLSHTHRKKKGCLLSRASSQEIIK